MTELKAAIEERLAKMTCESTKHEASNRAGRRRLGDLIERKNKLIAYVDARRLLQMAWPERCAHEAGEEELSLEAELGRQQRQHRQKVNKEARNPSLACLEARQARTDKRRAAAERCKAAGGHGPSSC
jgi:hypothetical protein